MLGDAKKRCWKRQKKKTLGSHDVGRQRGWHWQPGRWATKAKGDQDVRQRQDMFEQQHAGQQVGLISIEAPS